MARNIRQMNIRVKHHYPRRGLPDEAGSAMMHSMKAAEIRKRRKLTQIDLSALTDLSQATISRAENGDGGSTLDTYRAMAKVLNVPLWELFADDLTGQELMLLDAFRRLEPARQSGWIDMARAFLADQPSPSRKSG